jgi:hypothetical protein
MPPPSNAANDDLKAGTLGRSLDQRNSHVCISLISKDPRVLAGRLPAPRAYWSQPPGMTQVMLLSETTEYKKFRGAGGAGRGWPIGSVNGHLIR